MQNLEYYKICPECNKHFDARRLNQKFCDNQCKIRYNNRNLRASYQSRKKEESICKDINNVLFKNRQILQQFEGKTVKIEDLIKEGFVKRYVTQFEPVSDKKTRFYCYDMGYEFLDKSLLTIFRRA